jgi:hypothetical protein
VADEEPVTPASNQTTQPARPETQDPSGPPADSGPSSEAENQPSGDDALELGSGEEIELREWLNRLRVQAEGPRSGPPIQGPAATPVSGNDGRNVWDFLSVVVVVAGLVGLVLFLLDRSNLKPSDIESILGIVVPVFAAVVGATVGVAAGHVTGKSAGKKAARAYLMPRISLIETARSQPRSRLSTPFLFERRAQGSQAFASLAERFASADAVDTGDDAVIDSALGEMKGYLDSL